MDQRSGDGWFIGRIKTLAIGFSERIFQTSRCWTNKLLLLWIRSPSRNWMPWKRIGFYNTFVIHDFFWVTDAHDSVLDYAVLFSVTLRDDNVQECDTRWDEVLLIYDKDPTGWCSRKSVQIENTWVYAVQNRIWIVRHGDSSKDIDAQLSEIEDDGEKECRSEITITKLWRQTRENLIRSRGQESKRINWRWTRKRYMLPVERKRPMFEGRPL